MTQEDAFAAFKKGAMRYAPPFDTTFRFVEKPGIGIGGSLSDFNIEVVTHYEGKRFGKAICFSGELLEDDAIDENYFMQHGEQAGMQAQRSYLPRIAGYEDFDQFYNAGLNVQINAAPERSKIIVRNEIMMVMMKEKHEEEYRRMVGLPPK